MGVLVGYPIYKRFGKAVCYWLPDDPGLDGLGGSAA